MHEPQTTSGALLRHLTVAGAAVLSGAAANAQIAVTNVNQNVGFAAGDLSSLTLSGLPVNASVRAFSSGGSHVVYLNGMLAIKPLLVGPGRKFSTIGGAPRTSVSLGAASAGGRGAGKFTDQFFAFTFQDGPKTDFGWLEASLTDNTFDNLTVNVVAFAFDASGTPITTGQTSSAVPEPGSETAVAAFGALTLGAAGVRRLKALKR